MTVDFGAERGLFHVRDDARHDATYEQSELRKNVDFLRLKDVALHLVDPKPGRAVLDLGCANGAGMVYCGLLGATVFGQDLDPRSVQLANEKLAHLQLAGEARVGDVTSLAFDDDAFDAVLSSDFHEHLTAEQQVAALTEVRRVLKPGGRLVLKTPNLRYLRLSLNFKRVRALARGASPRGFVIPHTPGTNDPQHVGLTTHWELYRQLAAAGFLNWRAHYPPLRRFGRRRAVEVLSTEIPVVREWLCEDVIVEAWKPIALSLFPD